MNDLVLTEWVAEKIRSEPDKYGCDTGGGQLLSDYLYKVHPEGGRIPVSIAKKIPSVDRERRKYLEEHQEHDKRVEAQRFRNHSGEMESKGQTHIEWRDDISIIPSGEKISDQLYDHSEDNRMVDLKVLRQQIKDAMDRETAEEILTSIGYEIQRDHKFKLRDENTASTSIRRDGLITDFGDGWSGDIVALLHEHRNMGLKEATLFTADHLGITHSTSTAAPRPIISTKRAPLRPNYDLEAIHRRFMEDRKRVDPEVLIKKGNELIDYHFHKSCLYSTAAKDLFGYSSHDDSATIHLADKEGKIQTIVIRKSGDVKWKTYGSKKFTPCRIDDDYIFLYSGMAEIAIMKMLGLSFIGLQSDSMVKYLPFELKELTIDKTIIVLQDNDDSFRKIIPEIESFFKRSDVLIIDFERLLERELSHGYDFRDLCNEIKSAHGVMIMIEEEIIRLQEVKYAR